MFAEWVIGLLVVVVATPVAIASYVSAHTSAAERQPPQPVRVLHRAPAPPQGDGARHHRHYHRHLAA